MAEIKVSNLVCMQRPCYHDKRVCWTLLLIEVYGRRAFWGVQSDIASVDSLPFFVAWKQSGVV